MSEAGNFKYLLNRLSAKQYYKFCLMFVSSVFVIMAYSMMYIFLVFRREILAEKYFIILRFCIRLLGCDGLIN